MAGEDKISRGAFPADSSYLTATAGHRRPAGPALERPHPDIR